MDALRLRGIRCACFLGVTDAERARAQEVEFDVEVRGSLETAGRSDALADALDYVRVVAAVRGSVEGVACHLLEALAERAAQAALGAGAQDVVVRARKFAPPVPGGLREAEVEIRRVRA